MVKVIGTKKEIQVFLLQLQCPIYNEDLLLQECPTIHHGMNCLECCAKEYKLEIEYID